MKPPEAAKDLQVVIACEDLTDADQVFSLLERIGRNCETKVKLVYNWWNFDGLTITTLRNLAAMEAAAADIIVIATRDLEELPEEIIDWLSQCQDVADFHPRALVALLNLNLAQKKVSQFVISQLKRVAEWGQMDFFANGAEGKLEAALTEGLVPTSGNSSGRTERRITRIAGRSGNATA